jgi:hypothetical protein
MAEENNCIIQEKKFHVLYCCDFPYATVVSFTRNTAVFVLRPISLCVFHSFLQRFVPFAKISVENKTVVFLAW